MIKLVILLIELVKVLPIVIEAFKDKTKDEVKGSVGPIVKDAFKK